MKIQSKRSNVLDGGVAKAPTAEQMEYGELAINYSAVDPAFFIKDSSNTIIKLDINDIASALQAGDNVSTLVNDAGYITNADIPSSAVISVNTKTGIVVLNAADVGAATIAQGDKADSATQPGNNVSTLANDAGYITSAAIPAPLVVSVNSKTGAVILNATDVGALQTGDNITTLVNNAGYITSADIPGSPVVSVNGKTGIVVLDSADVGAATAAQGILANSAVQPGDNVSTLVNNAGYITLGQVPAPPVDSVNSKTGAVVLSASDVGAATTAQGATADTATQPGDNVSSLNNDAGYITSGGAPVQSVNGKTGTAVLSASDVGAATTAQGATADTATQPGDNVSTLANDAGYITDAGVTSIIAGDNISVDQSTGAVTVSTAANVGAVAILSDIQSAIAEASLGGWQPRVFNTVDDTNSLVSLNGAGTEFTLQPGSYLITWLGTSLMGGAMGTRLTNVTTNSTVGPGTGAYSNAGADYGSVFSQGTAHVQIASASTFKVEQNSAGGIYAFGYGVTGEDNLFAQVVITGWF